MFSNPVPIRRRESKGAHSCDDSETCQYCIHQRAVTERLDKGLCGSCYTPQDPASHRSCTHHLQQSREDAREHPNSAYSAPDVTSQPSDLDTHGSVYTASDLVYPQHGAGAVSSYSSTLAADPLPSFDDPIWDDYLQSEPYTREPSNNIELQALASPQQPAGGSNMQDYSLQQELHQDQPKSPVGQETYFPDQSPQLSSQPSQSNTIFDYDTTYGLLPGQSAFPVIRDEYSYDWMYYYGVKNYPHGP
ncbi:hypothetical protein F4804DRAFT_337662 [Jackrogersella minutella]|nr:hypothetical protein F4804DRAFT_337662 [Jackrogersella minutella]